jgi:hypothetical protein
MIKIALIKFVDGPWDRMIQDIFYKVLVNEGSYNVTKLHDYPKNNDFFDLIILCGIRSIIKNNLDAKRLKNSCKYLADMGDSGLDPRTNVEDLYFYFLPSDKKLYKHYHYLPKFVDEEHLYSEQSNEKLLTIFIDHYKHQNDKEIKISYDAIFKVFEIIKNSNFPLKVFYQTSAGVIINPHEPEIPKNNLKQNYKILPFTEIAKYYRKTHIFFPTHRETQGMVAHEIGACGAITLLQEWMYPKSTINQFPHIIYNQEDKTIDFEKIFNYLNDKNRLMLNRQHVLNNVGIKNFSTCLLSIIKNIF